MMLQATTLPAAEIYKWTDAAGHVHFGDKPSSGEAEIIRVKPASAAPATTGPENEAARRERTQRLLNEYAAERDEREEAKAEKAAALAEQRERCAAARRKKADLEQSAYLYTRDEAGNKQILPDSEFRKERARLEAQVDELCRGAAGVSPRR